MRETSKHVMSYVRNMTDETYKHNVSARRCPLKEAQTKRSIAEHALYKTKRKYRPRIVETSKKKPSRRNVTSQTRLAPSDTTRRVSKIIFLATKRRGP
ncbi:hypothetical protein BDV39DRAFT_88032 [Aspergillus sergii]|uniref:Uncharacterized protein n=1 Tax=Aspergillus sergii TaxID=1034303 RepID=A0A5N6X026_9EURO|nr:hypothetical protein BDV39DRAFT_88032 [Aspergillus sergii]